MLPRLLRSVVAAVALVAVGSASAALDAQQADSLTAALSPFQRRKAESLLATRLPCLGCHTIDGAGGHVGPDLSDVGSRRPPDYIARMIRDPQTARPGSLMPPTPMPDSWRVLLARYLVGRGGPIVSEMPVVPTAPPSESDTSGAALYARHCAVCHGAEGRGDGPNARNLADRPTAHADSVYMSTRPDDTIYDGIAAGAYILGKSQLMPAYGEMLTRREIRSLVSHIRRLCRCERPAWSRDP